MSTVVLIIPSTSPLMALFDIQDYVLDMEIKLAPATISGCMNQRLLFILPILVLLKIAANC